jgi:hypothetical protein
MIAPVPSRSRRGAVLPLVAMCLVVLVAMVALAIDIGIIAIARNQCQNAADAAALAGCRSITGNADQNYNYDAVPENTIQAAVYNNILGDTIGGDPKTDWNPTSQTQKSQVHPNDHTYITGQVKVEVGSYTYYYNDNDPAKEDFKLQFPRSNTAEPYSAVKATVSYSGDFSFGRVLGMTSFAADATATAVHRPRDVVIIMDLSGSMRFQSLPAGPYFGSRSYSMNPETVYPLFGHYSSSSAALQGTLAMKSGSGEYYDPCNISVKTNSGPPILEYFFQNDTGVLPSVANRAFIRAPDNYGATPGGQNYLKTNKNTGSAYAKTLGEIVGSTPSDIEAFAASGYDLYLGAGKFKDYTQGPGYWGKTFFIWPPDPRGATNSNATINGAKDWRQRFFFKRTSGGTLSPLDHNNVLWSSYSGNLYRPGSTYVGVTEDGFSRSYNYRVNYVAILKWLDTDPKPFPPRLRAGRIKYYDAFPNYNDTNLNSRWWSTSTNSLSDLNERFWKGYIDFVLGFDENGNNVQSKIGNGPTFEWGDRQIKQKPDQDQTGQTTTWYGSGHTGTISINNLSDPYYPAVGSYVRFGSNTTLYKITSIPYYSSYYRKVTIDVNLPLAGSVWNDTTVKFYKTYPTYMELEDNPNRPKHHLWFGPMTLVDYLGNYNTGKFWWPGNVPEAQSWSCKVGIQSAIDDIKNNHPNDFVGLTFFSSPKYSQTGDGQHNTAVVPLGRNYQQLKDSLWFPPSTITGSETEIHPWHDDFDSVPRAKGGTCPGMGFMIAYNLFSSSATNLRSYAQPQPQYRGVVGGLGRKGAARIVIFETDGVPNWRGYAGLSGSGKNSYYPIRVKDHSNLSSTNNVEWPSGGYYNHTDVYNVVQQIARLETDSPPGYSTERKPVQVFCLGYGTLFDPANASDSDQSEALQFLQTIQYYGNTATTTNSSSFPANQLIYGTSAERVGRMQAAFTSILQGGVQVSLIE